MIRLIQFLGILLVLMGIITMMDLYNVQLDWFGHKIRGNSFPMNSKLQAFMGIALIVIGIFIAIPRLSHALNK